MINPKVNWPGAVVGGAVGSLAALLLAPSLVKEPTLLPEGNTDQGIQNMMANQTAKREASDKRAALTTTIGVAGFVLGGFLLS